MTFSCVNSAGRVAVQLSLLYSSEIPQYEGT